jgi:Flagellar biosynthesis pathway, component FlhA
VPPESQDASWEDVAPIDTLGLEVGYRLIPLVDNNADGELVRRIKGIRKKFAREIGFLPPAVHIRDNLDINPNSYRITLKGRRNRRRRRAYRPVPGDRSGRRRG